MILVQFSLGIILLCQVVTDARYHDSAASGRDKEVKPIEISIGETAGLKRDSRHITEEISYDERPQKRQRIRRKRRQYTYGQYPLQTPFRDTRYDMAPYDYFEHITKTLDEIVSLIRQPTQQPAPPPPLPLLQPLYVPYFIYIPQVCNGGPPATSMPNSATPSTPKTTYPSLNSRFKDIEDQRQVWGVIDSSPASTKSNPKVAPASDNDDYDDVPMRPISFTPVKPDRLLSRPPPSIEHGTAQADLNKQPTEQPAAPEGQPELAAPSYCQIATVTCCHYKTPTIDCFKNYGCTRNIRVADACKPSVVSSVIAVFKKLYNVQT